MHGVGHRQEPHQARLRRPAHRLGRRRRYLTERGERLAAIVPAEIAAELENLSPEGFRELLEDFADAAAARTALAEDGEPVPWEQVKSEAGL